jgi:hypothetical protein
VRKTLIEGVRDYLIVSYLPVRDCVIVSTTGVNGGQQRLEPPATVL